MARPAVQQARPLPTVLWCHGFRADALAHAAQLEQCAQAGFLAVGIDAVGHGARREHDIDARIAHDAERKGYSQIRSQAEAPLSVAAGYLIREKSSQRALPRGANTVADMWRPFFEEQAGATLEGLDDALGDQASFARLARRIISDLGYGDQLGDDPDQGDDDHICLQIPRKTTQQAGFTDTRPREQPHPLSAHDGQHRIEGSLPRAQPRAQPIALCWVRWRRV
jgi:cobalamin biosynthesis protein CobT